MTQLESALVQLGGELVWPATPDVAPAVRRRLAEHPTRGLRLPARRTLGLIFAVLAVAVGAAMAVPPARTAVLDFLGLRGATVERVETLPRARASAARALELGRATSLAEAAKEASFEILAPQDLGDPDGVFYDNSVPGGRVSLVYAPQEGLPRSRFTGVGLLVTEFRGDLSPELVGKVLEGSTTAERVTVDGDPGLWMGGPHVFFYRDSRGLIAEETTRLAGNTLLLQRGNVLVRFEGSSGLTQERALELAGSLEES